MNLFISYSHSQQDDVLREQLVNHLATLEDLVVWCDRNILPGQEWETKIDENLNDADMILLLVSSDFLASSYCKLEAKRAMERYDAEGVKVIPIILRDCYWQLARFAKLDALPKEGVPVIEWSSPDKAFTDIARGIHRVVKEAPSNSIAGSQVPVSASTARPETAPPIAEDQARNSAPKVNEGASSSPPTGSTDIYEQDDNVIESFYNNLLLLSEQEQVRFFELAVFPPGLAIPLATIKKLWANDLSGDATNALCARLRELSLINYDDAGGFVRLHELIRLHLIKQDIGNNQDYYQPRLPSIHLQLVNSHKPHAPHKWSDLPDDEPYFWDHLAFHLKEAERGEELIKTIKDWQYLTKKTRLRKSSSIEGDLLTYQELDSSDSRLRTAQLIYSNLGSLFDSWIQSGGIKAQQFAELRSLEDMNIVLQDQAQRSGMLYLTLKFELPNSTVNVRRCRFSHNGDLVVSTTDEGPLVVWETKSGTIHSQLVRSAPYDERLGQRRVEIDGHEQEVRSCDFGPAGKLIASASADRTLKIWSIKLCDVIRTLLIRTSVVNDCRFSPNGKLIVSAFDDGTLRTWEVENNKPPNTLQDSAPINCCAFGNDGRWVISGSSDGTLKIWDVESREPLDALAGHSNAINDCSFSDRTRKIASASADGTLNIWDADSRDAPRHILRDHSAAVNGCCFSGDGKLIVSASSDRTLKVWDVQTGQCRTTFVADDEMFCCAIYGDTVVAGGARGVYFLRLVGCVQEAAIDSTVSRYGADAAVDSSVLHGVNTMKSESAKLNLNRGSIITDPTGRCFVSYRRTRVDEAGLLIAALHDRGVPTWQDLSNLGMGQAEESLRKTLGDPMICSGILWLTPDVADSAMIGKVEMPEMLKRARNDEAFFALLVAAGNLDYNGVAELGKGYVPYDLASFNISKVIGDPIDHIEAARIARLVLRQRIEKLHRHLPADEPLVVNIYTGTSPPFQAGKALTIDWTQRFVGGRSALSGAWKDYLLPALKDIVEAIQTQAPERAVEITGLLSLPGAVALGCIFLEPRGIKISWRPRQSPNQLWNIKEPRQTSGFVSTLSPDTLGGEDLAILVSVDNNVSSAFTRSKPHLGVEFRAISEVKTPGLASGVTRSEISTPGEAADIAYVVRQAIIIARNQYSEIRRTHLFVAAPVGLAMMIGQLMNTCGMIQTYEFNADNHDCPYQPAVLLNPTW